MLGLASRRRPPTRRCRSFRRQDLLGETRISCQNNVCRVKSRASLSRPTPAAELGPIRHARAEPQPVAGLNRATPRHSPHRRLRICQPGAVMAMLETLLPLLLSGWPRLRSICGCVRHTRREDSLALGQAPQSSAQRSVRATPSSLMWTAPEVASALLLCQNVFRIATGERRQSRPKPFGSSTAWSSST
jgi:hypothetical protein